jgi:MYXO-CTERM domain-containing protein
MGGCSVGAGAAAGGSGLAFGLFVLAAALVSRRRRVHA